MSGVVVFSAMAHARRAGADDLLAGGPAPGARRALPARPDSRRPRAILIGDDIFAKVGAYVLGNLAISVIAGTATLIWLLAFGVPYALLLALFVALLDLIPAVGSTIAGIVAAWSR